MTRYGLPVAGRLRTRSQFDYVLDHNCSSSDRYFVVYARPQEAGHARLGLVVSRRVSPKAVVRNRIKRQAREAFRHSSGSLTGLDVVVVARAGAADAINTVLQTALAKHWEQVINKCASC